jgi:hypothetical protein
LKLVYICSPLRGAIEENIKKAHRYCEYAAGCDVIPLAPHTIFTAYLQDTIPEQRAQGLKMGLELLKRCDEIWVNVKRFVMKSRILKPVETQALRQENFA